LPYALLAGLLQPVKERLRRVLEEAATSQKMTVGDNRGSSNDFVCQLVQRPRASDSLRSFSKA
jgi:hypothetical protein